MRRILESSITQVTLATLILGVALLCIFTPDVILIKRGANFTVQIMLLFLFLGIGFLMLGQKRLMFTSLFACGILSLFLKNASDQSLRFPSANEQPQVSVAHIDLSLSDDYTETMRIIWSTDVDVISFQEYTPDWHNYLQQELQAHYPHQNIMMRIDPFGMALYSKYELSNVDTVIFNEFDEMPCLYATLGVDEETQVHVVSAHTLPAVNRSAYERIRSHFSLISNFIDELDGPVITVGDFSLPSWSQEIKDFKDNSSLSDSRRDMVPAVFNKPLFMLNIPIDHIFYSDDIECTSFKVIDSQEGSQLGILGKYQLKEFAQLTTPTRDY